MQLTLKRGKGTKRLLKAKAVIIGYKQKSISYNDDRILLTGWLTLKPLLGLLFKMVNNNRSQFSTDPFLSFVGGSTDMRSQGDFRML